MPNTHSGSAPALSLLTLTISNNVALVALNRPQKANALNRTLWKELRLCFEYLDGLTEVRAIVLAAQGKHFCAGIDLSMFETLIPSGLEPARAGEAMRETIIGLQEDLSAIEKCRKPVLAAVHALCVGAGVDLICCADMRYCSEQAIFSIKEIDIGMTADVGTLQRLPTLISPAMARELAYTGRDMLADEALSLGFVNKVYADSERLLEGVMEVAQEIARKSPIAIRGTKAALLYARDHSVADSLQQIATWSSAMLSVEDVQKSIAARAEGSTAIFDD